MSSLQEAAVEKIQVRVMGIYQDSVAIEYYQPFVTQWVHGAASISSFCEKKP